MLLKATQVMIQVLYNRQAPKQLECSVPVSECRFMRPGKQAPWAV